MVQSGLLACSQTFDAAACIVYLSLLQQQNSGVLSQFLNANHGGLHPDPSTLLGLQDIFLPVHIYLHGPDPSMYPISHISYHSPCDGFGYTSLYFSGRLLLQRLLFNNRAKGRN